MNDWINSPLLKDIDPVKLELIKMAASQTSGKSGKDLAPVMLALITSANKKGIRFTCLLYTSLSEKEHQHKCQKTNTDNLDAPYGNLSQIPLPKRHMFRRKM